MASMATNDSCEKKTFSLGSNYCVYAFRDWYPYCGSVAKPRDTDLGQGVMLFQVSLKSVTSRVGAVLHLIPFSHLFLCLMYYQNVR